MRCRRTGEGPQLLVVTDNAATQRLLTPFRVRQLTRRLARRRAGRSRSAGRQLQCARLRASRVGRRARRICRARVARRPVPRGRDEGARLDFFGDEIESMRRFDPADQRTTDRAEAFTLMPASEALLDEESDQALPVALPREVRRHRDRRSALPGDFGRAADEPAWSIGCRCSRRG